MKSTSLAKALFEEFNSDINIIQHFIDLEQIINNSPDLKLVLSHLCIKSQVKFNIIQEVLKKTKIKSSELLDILEFLLQNDDLELLLTLGSELLALYKKSQNITPVTIISPAKCDSNTQAELESLCNKHYSNPEYTYKVDQSLLKGLYIQTPRHIIDNTIKNKLSQIS